MTTTTSITNIMNQNKKGLGVRNAHLKVEARKHTKRVVERAVEETKVAFQVNPTWCAYYKRLTSGRRCTCKEESRIDNYEDKYKTEGLNLSDFLINVPQLVPTDDVCPICFNTGFVGGYGRLGSINMCFDYTNASTYSKIVVNKERPYWFNCKTNKPAYIEWEVIIPTYFKDITDIAIRWKEEPRNWSLLLNGSAISKELLFNSIGQTVTLRLEMKDGSSKGIGLYAMFITFSVNDNYLVPSNYPEITRSASGEMNIVNEISSPQSVYFDTHVTQVDNTDLFIDQRWRRLWRVVEVLDKIPMEDIKIYWETQARLVRDWELYYTLPNKTIRGIYKSAEVYSFIM